MQSLIATIHMLGTAACDGSNPQCIQGGFKDIASVLVNSALFLVPVFVIVGGLHKLMEHRESAGTFALEVLLKSGAAVLVFGIAKAWFGL